MPHQKLSITRLHLITTNLAKFAQPKRNTQVSKVLDEFFETNDSSPDLLRCIAAYHIICDTVVSDINLSQVMPDRLKSVSTNDVNFLKQTTSFDHYSNAWHQIEQYFTDEVLDRLLYTDIIIKCEKKIDLGSNDDDIDNLVQEGKTLLENILASRMDEAVKKIVVNHVREIILFLDAYDLFGVDVLKDKVCRAIVEAIDNKDVVDNSELSGYVAWLAKIKRSIDTVIYSHDMIQATNYYWKMIGQHTT